MNGAKSCCTLVGRRTGLDDRIRDRRPEALADAGQAVQVEPDRRSPPPARAGRTAAWKAGGTVALIWAKTGPSWAGSSLAERRARTCVPGDGQADRAADLAEEGQVGGRHAELLERHGVLDDDREHRRAWARCPRR